MRKFYFANRVVDHWNSLPDWVVAANNYRATVCKTVRPMPSDRRRSCLSVCLSVLTVCDVGDAPSVCALRSLVDIILCF